MTEAIAKLLDQVRAAKPLVHHITNYVTVNDCANAALEIGASPVMADDIDEAADIASISDALVLNMGTLNERTVTSMIAAGKSANAAGVPVVFDPVGAGASGFRDRTAAKMLNEVKISVLRGNISEIRSVSGLAAETKGVDASGTDIARAKEAGFTALELARKLGIVVVISGAEDVISDGNNIVYIQNGHPLLGGQTGTGCMCSTLIGAFCGTARDRPFTAAAAGMLCMGVAGEMAFLNAKPGNGSFRAALHDALSRLSADNILKMAKIREA